MSKLNDGGYDKTVAERFNEPGAALAQRQNGQQIIHEPAQQPVGGADELAELLSLLREIRPSHGDVGTRDVDVTAQQARIDRAIELLSQSQPSGNAGQLDEREAFEAWAATQSDSWLIVGGLTWSPGTNDYASARTNAAFAAWQARAALAAQASGQDRPLIARHFREWDEDDGPVMWWAWCGHEWAGEPAWCSTPLDSDWPGYHTHWTPHPALPEVSARAAAKEGE